MASLLDIAGKFAEYIPRPFVAPLPSRGDVRIFSMQDGVPMWYSVPVEYPGWHVVYPTRNKGKARVGEVALPGQALGYLAQLPRFFCVVCIPPEDGKMLVVPSNPSDARQRGWLNGQPMVVHLVRHPSIQLYDWVIVRKVGGMCLYDDVDTRICQDFVRRMLQDIETAPSGMQTAVRIASDWQKELTAKAVEEERKARLQTEEGRLSAALEFTGAKLVGWEKRVGGYKVTWDFGGRQYTVGLNDKLRVTVPGLCLSGGEVDHNLTSIVAVIERARELNRPFYDVSDDHGVDMNDGGDDDDY